jgi:hypothetical protein
MRSIFKAFIFVLFLGSILSAQESSREQKIQELQAISPKIEKAKAQLTELENRQTELEGFILEPTDADYAEAEKENASAFRIFPRGLLEDKISVRGGAAYYSFSTESHSYDDTPQIELQNGNLSVGFAGADYGFITDLDKLPLSQISEQTKGVNFLVKYAPPTVEEEARNEFRKIRQGFKVDEVNYNKSVSAIVGHSYVLRAISFDEADILVVFNVYRKDTDGSLIIFWKLIENFKTPRLEKNTAVVNIRQNPDTEIKVLDYAVQQAIQDSLVQNGLNDVSVEATTTEVTLRGTVPKGKLADAVRITHEMAKRKVSNQLTER